MVWQAYRRTASSGACSFCLMLASRGAVYMTEATAVAGHDHCNCGAELETNPDDRTAIRIDPADANKIIRSWTARGKTATYDLSQWRKLGVKAPPKAKVPKAVKPKPKPKKKQANVTDIEVEGQDVFAKIDGENVWLTREMDELGERTGRWRYGGSLGDNNPLPQHIVDFMDDRFGSTKELVDKRAKAIAERVVREQAKAAQTASRMRGSADVRTFGSKDWVMNRARVGRDRHLLRKGEQPLMSESRRLEFVDQLDDLEARAKEARKTIKARVEELRAQGITGKELDDLAAGRRGSRGVGDPIILTNKWKLTDIADSKSRLERRLSVEYETTVKGIRKPIPDKVELPEFDPDNPLSFYGDVLQMDSAGPKVEEMLRQLEALPQRVHEALREYYLSGRQGSGIYISEHTELPDLDDLGRLRRGPGPRGWAADSSWDQVTGVHQSGGIGSARVTAVAKGGRSGSGSTVLHEIGHALDDIMERGEDWNQLWEKVLDDLESTDIRPYFTRRGNPSGYLSESWAEMNSTYWLARMRAQWGKVRPENMTDQVVKSVQRNMGLSEESARVLVAHLDGRYFG